MGPQFLNWSVETNARTEACPSRCMVAGQQLSGGQSWGEVWDLLSTVWARGRTWHPAHWERVFYPGSEKLPTLIVGCSWCLEFGNFFFCPYVWCYVLRSRGLYVCFYVCSLGKTSWRAGGLHSDFSSSLLFTLQVRLYVFAICIYSFSMTVLTSYCPVLDYLKALQSWWANSVWEGGQEHL